MAKIINREITIATGEKLYKISAEIISREINGETFEFGIHPRLVQGEFQDFYYSMSEVRTGLFMWSASTKLSCKKQLIEWLSKVDPKRAHNLITGHPPVEDLPEIYEHKVIEALQRKEDWKKLTKILGFTPKGDGLVMAMSNKFTLDIVALDKRVNCPDDISLSNHIKKVYGKEAEKLVSKLI
jgi:hypothetical protein